MESEPTEIRSFIYLFIGHAGSSLLSMGFLWLWQAEWWWWGVCSLLWCVGFSLL